MKTRKLDREGDLLFIGTYELGDEVVALVGDMGSGNGQLYLGRKAIPPHSKCGNLACLRVGLEHKYWSQALEILLHEALELIFVRQGVRFTQTENYSRTHASYLFNLTHEQFTEALARVAPFLSIAQCDLCQVYKQVRRQKTERCK